MFKMINTIVLDLGETYMMGFEGVQFKLEPLLGINPEKIYEGLRGHQEMRDLFNGKITEEKFLSSVIEKNSWNLSVDDFREAIEIILEK